jgi:hypothetical protein
MILRNNVLQHVSIEEDQCIQRLVLTGRRQSFLQNEVVEERFDVDGVQMQGRDP